MSVQAEQVNVKKDKFYLHIGITLLLMLGVGFLPPPEPITPLGMRIIGIFIGAIYGWTFVDMLWPSILGLATLGLTLGMTPVLNGSLGNPVIAMMLLIFPFLALVNMCHLDSVIAYWMITRKVLSGKPWLFSFVFLLAAYVSGMINVIAGILILWSILYKILDQFGYKPYDPYATLMMCGTVLCGTLGITAVPFHGNTLVILTAYASISGSMVDFLQYMSFSIPIGLLLIMVYTLICRFIFHPDVSLIKNIDVSIFEQNKPKLEKKQKIVAALLILFVVLLMTPSVLPKTWLLTKFISGLGLFGAAAVVVLLALAIRIKGKSLMDFKEMAQNGMVWDIFFLSALALPMSSALTAEGTGVKEFIILIMQPLLSGKSGMLFIGIVMILAALLTNVANNTVLALIIVPIIYSFASEVGVDSAAAVALLVLCTHMAIITPAASPMAGMLFANTAWVKAKDVYKYMSVILAAFIVIAISAGYFWLNIVF